MNNLNKNTTCCFTGHRFFSGEPKSAVFNNLCLTIRRLYAEGITTFISGGALGFDTLAALAVLKLRRELPCLKLILVLPCRDQHAKWPYADKQAYEEILCAADEVVCLNESYRAGCMHQRNRVMVKLSSICIAYYTGKPGGTAFTVALAQKDGMRIINLAAFQA